MQTVIIVLHLMIVATLIVAVLLQKSEGGGLGIGGGGGGGGFMSSRGTANLLTRTTAILAAGFFITSLTLSWLASYDRKPASVINQVPASQTQPGAPVAPVSEGGGLLDTLKKQDQQESQPAPAAPEPPRSQ
ncbi:protein translocase subunit secG [Rhodopseudomonas faecalis]|uniref:Protein-export membrane protein SecG n=1 Tax=Rhodopseudomonas faecalis TaxID=99655 RepID=A0A318TNN3_9BRAD|nr:preprotein translocase subunit SecG [Rhodopseudomonas faecalis]PYF05507.1 protein translocase subunit secG [Rhodopseudomonas faecalis]TAH66140.1 MAG: preprotein translocase subunit SecG [Rhodopseudomonas palustris]